MKTPLFFSLALSFFAFAPAAKADPTCSDYPAFLRCVKQKQGTWQDCRQWHCEGGETSLRDGSLTEDAQARCTVGLCEAESTEHNSPNCQANSVPRPATIVRIMANGKAYKAKICGGRDCQMARESVAKMSGCSLE